MSNPLDKLEEILQTLSNIETEVEQIKENVGGAEDAHEVINHIYRLIVEYKRTH